MPKTVEPKGRTYITLSTSMLPELRDRVLADAAREGINPSQVVVRILSRHYARSAK